MRRLCRYTLAFVLLASLTAGSVFAFSDTASHWAARYIDEIRRSNIITGFPDGTFRPEDPVTRDQFIVIAVRTMIQSGLTPNDVAAGGEYWAQGFIDKAKRIGILYTNEFGGESRAIFEQSISRGEIISILARVILALKLPLDKPVPNLSDLGTLTEPLKSSADIVLKSGVMVGNSDGTLGVRDKTTRSQVATVIYRVLNTAPAPLPKPTPAPAAKLGEIYKPDLSTISRVYQVSPSVRWYLTFDNYANFRAVAVNSADQTIAIINQKEYDIASLPSHTLSDRIPELYTLPGGAYLVVFRDKESGTKLFHYEFTGNYSTFEIAPADETQRLAFEQMTEDLVNVFRVSQGLSPVERTDVARRYCRLFSEDMATRNFFNHTTPDGKTFKDRVIEAGLTFTNVGENLAWNYMTPFELTYAWMNSPGHRANLLNPAFINGAVGIKYRSSDKNLYATQLLYR